MRSTGKPYYPKKSRKPLEAVRLSCFDYVGWDHRGSKDSRKPVDDARGCTGALCPLFDFRLGKNPFLRGGKGNLENLLNFRQKGRKLS